MKNLKLLFLITVLLHGCSINKNLLTDNDISQNNVIIIGTIEYDYSELTNKTISGIQLYMESDKEMKEFRVAEKSVEVDDINKKNSFIGIIGKYGDYRLSYMQNISFTPQTDILLAQVGIIQNSGAIKQTILHKYSINEGKVINIGKIVVKYKGGEIKDGHIKYSYSVKSFGEDSVAMNIFKVAYPTIYEKYQDEIYTFKSRFKDYLLFILNNISDEKKAYLTNFIEENPNKVNEIFYDLNNSTQEKYVQKITGLTMEEFVYFLTSTNKQD